MGKVSYEAAKQHQETYNNDRPYIGRFYLSDDNDEAVVRILHDDIDSFDIVASHNVQTNGKYRDINCVRDFSEPVSNCPLCAMGNKARVRMYIHLLQYDKDEQGNITCTPKVWDRGIDYREKLKSYLENYGPLSDIMCKIIRHGAKGDMQTKYEFVPNLSPVNFPPELYVKDESHFDDYNSIGTVVWAKSKEDMEFYAQNKEFPQRQQNVVEESSPLDVTPEAPVTPPATSAPPVVTPPVPSTPVAPVAQPATDRSTVPPWERSSANGVSRPVRQY